MPDSFHERQRPVDGDNRPMGGTNRYAGMRGVILLISTFFGILVITALVLMFATGTPSP